MNQILIFVRYPFYHQEGMDDTDRKMIKKRVSQTKLASLIIRCNSQTSDCYNLPGVLIGLFLNLILMIIYRQHTTTFIN